MTVQWPDVEGAVRTYLRAHTDVVAQVGARVFFGIPDEPTWPLIVVSRVGGFEDPSDAPIDQAMVQLDCWGAFHLDGSTEVLTRPNKASATAVLRAVRQAHSDLIHVPATVTVAGATVRIDGGAWQSDPYIPDPSDGRPRYVVTAQFTVRQMAAA
jgi:hypothetical protein